jgi:SAM-dependent methyltransferase
MLEIWNGTYREPAFWHEIAEALIAIADLAPGMRVLDVGSAGGGTLFPALERIGAEGHIIGIEVEEDWVEWLNEEIVKRGIENAENVLMNGQSMSFPDETFDAVIMGMVGLDEDYDFKTGEILNGAPMMREVYRVLKPGHFLHSSNWLWQDDSEWMGELVRRYLPDCTKRGYFRGTEEGYVRLIRTVGFTDVRVKPFEGSYTYEDPAEWMACVGYVWEEELAEIRSDPDVLESFEQDAFDLLADHTNSAGKIEYTRSALLIAARKPGM